MSSRTIRLPGPDGPEITIDKPSFGRPRVSVGGQAIDRVAGTKADYAIPMPDGPSRTIRLSGGLRGTTLTDADGSSIALDRQLHTWELALAFVPFVLIIIGGLIGGLFGGMASGVNIVIARSHFPTAARVGGMVAVTLIAAVAWFGVVLVIRDRTAEIPTATTGNCLNGVGPNIALTPENVKPVACETAHTGEVVGSSEMPGAAGIAYPGEAAMEDGARAACPSLFEAYVGVPFDSSSLSMYYVAPSSETWGRDDRTIICIAVDPQGGVLTGSAKGTAQ